MEQARAIDKFIHTQYFHDGLRLTFGTIVPALVFTYIANLQTGIVVAIGAMLLGLSDIHGPVSHRRNGMIACTILVLAVATITGYASHHVFLLGVVIFVLTFLLAMLAVYGARAASIGTIATVIMILNMDSVVSASLGTKEYLFLTLVGCIWYMLLSLSLYQVSPFRLTQQLLGEAVNDVAKYIKIKAGFYDGKTDLARNFDALIAQQISVHEHQDQVRASLFRSKKTIKDTTKTGRLLVMIFADIVDLYEQSMATHYDYSAIRGNFAHTSILPEFKRIILNISSELRHLGDHIIVNRKPKRMRYFTEDLERLWSKIEQLENTEDISTLPLKKIYINIRNIAIRIENIYSYFNKLDKNISTIDSDLSKFISKQDIDLKSFRENLTLNSNVFRHALRMGIVMATGYIISAFFDFGEHSYWILITILVIMKPGYGITKQRNFQRLTGTIIGGILGVIILLLVKNETALFVILVLLMIGNYSSIRNYYAYSVVFLTPMVLIMFSFMNINTLQIAQERIIDTVIGSALAFFSSYIIFPSWENTHARTTMRSLLIANYEYLAQALQIISGDHPSTESYKLLRKNVYVATANMGSSFQRMMAEPKSKQRNAADANKFVVFNHILSSYSVTLLNTVKETDQTTITEEHIKIIRKTLSALAQSIRLLEEGDEYHPAEIEVNLTPASANAARVSDDTNLISEQLVFLHRIASDLQKVCERMTAAKDSVLTIA